MEFQSDLKKQREWLKKSTTQHNKSIQAKR